MVLNFSDGSYLFKVNIQNIRTMHEICLKITKTPSDVNNVVLVPLLLTLNIFYSDTVYSNKLGTRSLRSL